ncbi:MAG: zinc ribbon domain-containing protein [Gammaproteobacteria bacterium]|nr:MAG: zinc ribbon domain-containing protein [Gammaproteobacteria bacterium]
MPIYEYRCDSCDTNFDAIQKFSDAPLTKCRACGAEGIRKLLSAPAFRLKGGGWYETDFKKDKQRNIVKSDGDGGKSGGSSGSSSDSGSKSSGGDSSSKSSGSDSGSKSSGSDSSKASGGSKSNASAA